MTTEYTGPPYLDTAIARWAQPIYNRVVRIELHGPKIDDSIAGIIAKFPCVRSIEFHRTQVTNNWLNEFRSRNPDCEVMLTN